MKVKRIDTTSEFGHLIKTPTGYRADAAVITRAGVFSYQQPDGTIHREFRSPEEVFKSDSMLSARMMPMTNLHPDALFVTPDNAKELSVGMTGELPRQDQDNLTIGLKVTHADGIKAIDDGRRQLSCGYSAEVIEKVGSWKGEKYDHAQINIEYNHLALVDEGRAGPNAALRLDGADAIMLPQEVKTDPPPTPRKEPTKMESTVKLDNGLPYKCDAEVAVEIEKLRKDAAAQVTKLEAVTKERDTLQGKHDALETEVEKLKKVDTAKEVAEGVKARIALESSARKVLDEETAKKLDEMGDDEIRVAVIKHTDEKFDADTEQSKNPVYLQARYDGALALAEKMGDKTPPASPLVGDHKPGRTDGAPVDPEQARLDAFAAQKARSVSGKKVEA